jgi:peroxiredoxin
MSVIQEVYNNWSGRGLVVLAVDFKETPAEVQKFIEEKHITFTVLLDPTSKVSKQYNVNGSNIPTTFFVDKNGIIKEIRNSAMNKGGIEAILESM